MKSTRTFFFFLLALFICYSTFAQESDLREFLETHQDVVSVEETEQDEFFSEAYVVKIKQPLDHADPSQGFFNQRVYISHKGTEKPVVFITDGYVAIQAQYSKYVNELCPKLQANQVDIEHRYFGESWPDPVNWDYLTVANAAGDHHHINKILREYYTGKFVSTGISKGGQTALFYRTLYPDDVEASVSYVAPLCFKVEDGRHEPYLANTIGTAAKRAEIEQFQFELIERRDRIFPMFEELIKEENYTFRVPHQAVYDYCLLEYPFALWQWGVLLDSIPGDNATDQEVFDHFVAASSPDYFAIEGMESFKSFFVQAAHELGYYGYDMKPFKKQLSIKKSKKYLYRVFLPEDLKIRFKRKTMRKVKKFLQTTNEEMIFIYGADDPWSAPAVDLPNRPNFLKVIKEGGSHRARVNNLPDPQKKLVHDKLGEWMEVNIKE
jgi:hypothetical protein